MKKGTFLGIVSIVLFAVAIFFIGCVATGHSVFNIGGTANVSNVIQGDHSTINAINIGGTQSTGAPSWLGDVIAGLISLIGTVISGLISYNQRKQERARQL